MAERISVDDLCRKYRIYMPHGKHVGYLSSALFDLLHPLHNLDERYRDVAHMGGLLHNVAFAGGVQKHHTRGRDILLETPLSDFPDEDRAIIAVTTVFHRKRWTEGRLEGEFSYTDLPEEHQLPARWLSVIIRIADGLDYSHSQGTLLGESTIDPAGTTINVLGPYVDIDAPRADYKCDMWRGLFDIPVTVKGKY